MRRLRIITLLDQYLFHQVLFALAAVTLGLTALIWLIQSLRFVELVVNHGLSLWVFLRLTSLLIPSFVAVVLPITTFVVVLFIYQRLVGDRELTVMRSMGLSPFTLARPALAIAALTVGAGYWLNLLVVPGTLRSFDEFQWEIRNRLAAFLLQDGVFSAISDDLTVYVRQRDADGTLRGVLVDDARDKTAHATILAETGRLVDAPDGLHVLLYRGSRQQIDQRTKRLNILTFHEDDLDLNEPSRNQARSQLNMSEEPVETLLHPPDELTIVDHRRWIAEAHKRLSTPIAALTYALIALLSVLTGEFQRNASVLRPLAAVGGVVSLVALNLMFQSLGARDNTLLFLLWAQSVLPPLVLTAVLFGPQIASVSRLSLRSQPSLR